MKKVIALLMCLFLAIGMVGCSAGGNPTSSGEGQMNNVENDAAAENSSVETVKIAHIAGFTGSFATYSEFERKAAELMQEYINDNGGIKSLGGANVEFVYYDHMSDASQVPSVFERAVEDPDVIAVLSNNSSSVTTAMLAGMEKAGVSLLTINSATALINQGYSYIFQNVFAASEVGATQVKFLQYMQENYGLDANKIGILFQDNDAGRDGGESSNAVLLANHGALTWGNSPMQAYMRMESLEYYALVSMYTGNIIGKANELSCEQVDRLVETRTKMGITTGGKPTCRYAPAGQPSACSQGKRCPGGTPCENGEIAQIVRNVISQVQGK